MVTGSLAPQNPYIVTVDDSDPDIVWQGVWGTSGTPPEYNRYQLSHRAVDEIFDFVHILKHSVDAIRFENFPKRNLDVR